MKSFKIGCMNTDAEGSPPPPPAPADPSVDAANAAAAAANIDGSMQYNEMYPTYNTYMMNRYTDQRYHTPYTGSSYMQQQQQVAAPTQPSASHISAHTSASAAGSSDSYYGGSRYPDYSSRYPYSGAGAGNPTSPTSPRWRRRSYDPDYLSRRTASASRPLSDLATTLTSSGSSPASTAASAALMRSRSRSRVQTGGSSDYDPNSYLRYMSPSTYTTRPMSGYIYGHSYNPSGSGSTGVPGTGTSTGYHVESNAGPTMQRMGSAPPQPPPNYNALEREVSARVRRYQQADQSS
jgi:hypothetical protein